MTPTTPVTRLNSSKPRRFHAKNFWLHVVLILGSAAMLLPFAWMLSTSLKTPPEIFRYPPTWIPDPIAWENYVRTLRAIPFERYYFNSLFVAVNVTLLQILTASLGAFAFARMRFWGRNALFLMYLATLMIPFQVTMIPNFILVRYLGWYDSFQALIFPTAFSAFAVFLLRQYFMGIPLEMDEAARMDGAGSFRIWWQIIMPLSTPVLAALTIFTFLGSWNDFLWPLIITNSVSTRTIPVGLAAFQGEYNTQWNLLMAGSVIALLPVLLIYFFAQKRFIEGITLSGMGGR
jgi:multiple sugar transport system permease protein